MISECVYSLLYVDHITHLTPGGYFRNFWVGMCRWDPKTLNLY